MPNLIFLDLETTGLDTSTCEIIECAFSGGTKIASELFKPSKPIPPEVSGITNIDNADVTNLPGFAHHIMCNYLKLLANSGEYIAVTHNTEFDLAVLDRYGIKFDRSICTHKLAWKLLPDLANHKLGTLRAYFGIPHTGEAHRADYDVKILKEVFAELADVWWNTLESKPKMSLSDMYSAILELSDQAKAEYLDTWHFGKFRGQKIDPIIHLSYILWNVNSNPNLDPKTKNYLQTLIA